MSGVKIAVDFDSLYTNIYMLGGGLVLSEPTVAAVDSTGKGDVKAVGEEARKIIGKTAKGTKIVFPVFEGEIVNEKVAQVLLKSFFAKIGINSKLFGVTAVVSVPCGISPDSLIKYERVFKSAGVRKIIFIEAPILSALGQHIPLNDFSPCFLIDMAGGVTNIAALTLDGIIAGVSVNYGSNLVITEIIDYIAEVFGLQIGILTAERLKKDIASLDVNDGLSTVINGRDIKTGTPKSLSVKASELVLPVKKYYDKVAEVAMAVLTKLPPEVSAEIRHSGVYVSGVGASVYGLKKYYSEKFDIKINLAENNEYSVAIGGGILVSDKVRTQKLAINVN